MLLSSRRSPTGRDRRNSLVSAVALLAVLLAGCADEGPALPQAEGYRSVRVIGRSAVDPSGEMLAVGCTASAAVASPTAVRILPRPGKPDVFECAGVAPDSVTAGIRRYLEATVAANGDAFIMAGTWVFASREYCYATGGWWQSDGTFYLPEGETLRDCFWMDTMIFVPTDFSGEWPRVPIPPGGGGPGSNTPPPPPSPPPPPTPAQVVDTMTPGEIACVQEDGESGVDWTGIDWDQAPTTAEVAPAFDPFQIDVCAGADASSCMSNNSGIWVGSMPLVGVLSSVRHTAIATTPPMQVSELKATLNDTPSGALVFNEVVPFLAGPRFQQGFQSYRWVRVGDPASVGRMNSAISRAAVEFHGDPYTFGSNRFVSNALRYAGLSLSEEQRAFLGRNPGLCVCGGVCIS
jgi:hypothetical protein